MSATGTTIGATAISMNTTMPVIWIGTATGTSTMSTSTMAGTTMSTITRTTAARPEVSGWNASCSPGIL
jgi:hypothetical protein